QETDKAKRESDPLNSRYLLAHEAISNGRGHDGLQAWYERRDAGRDALTDRREDSSEVEAVHQRPRDKAIADLTCVRAAVHHGLSRTEAAIASSVALCRSVRFYRHF